MSPKIVFFGNERLATGITTTAPAFRALYDAGYEIAAVVVAQGETGKSRNPRELEITLLAEEYGIRVISPENLEEAKGELEGYGAEIAVLAAYGKLVPKAVIDIFPHGIVNIHPSLLPEYRGTTPIESAILHGDPETGVSLMALAEELDTGPVYAQQKLAIKGDVTKKVLADQLGVLGSQMLIEYLPQILQGSLSPVPQNEEEASYTEAIEKTDGILDYLKPAQQLEREVRAYAGWPRSRIKIGTADVIVTQAHIGSASGAPGTVWLEDKQLGVFCAEGVLIIDMLIPTGKKEMSASAFLAGYKI